MTTATAPLLQAPGVVRGLLEMSRRLSSPEELETRLDVLCRDVVHLLGCDRSSILLWEGEQYRAAHNWGNPPHLVERFGSLRMPPSFPTLVEMNASRGHVVVNDARLNPELACIADAAGIDSIVFAPMFCSDWAPLGFITAEFNDRIVHFDNDGAELVMGAARLAQGAILADRALAARQQLLDELIGAEEIERRRIGREIHDDPLQRLFGLCLRLERLRDSAADHVSKGVLTELHAECVVASRSLRGLMNETHPIALEQVGLVVALNDQLRRRSAATGWSFIVVDRTDSAPPPQVAATILRIAEQALQNIQLHAEANAVTVVLDTRYDGTLMRVTDDGCGFDLRTHRTNRLGLISMRERSELSGGTFVIDSTPGQGTSVTVRIPHNMSVSAI